MEFNHDSNDLHEALGFTQDEMDELDFKANQLIKRDLNKSKTLEAALNWIKNKYEGDKQIVASMLLATGLERGWHAKRMVDMLKMMRGMKDGSAMTDKVAFANEEDMKNFTEEFKALVKEYGGDQISEAEDQGVLAISFDDDSKRDEFKLKLKALEEKYGVKNEGDDIMPFPFMGPIAEA